MESDPNFRLKAFVVIAGVLGVFLVSFVAQRVWYWLRTKGREDIEQSRLKPLLDYGLLLLGFVVIWLAIEGLLLSIALAHFKVQPEVGRKIAEVEVGRYDKETGALTLVFYPVNAAGHRQPKFRKPVFTSGSQMWLEVEVIDWRGGWGWLGGKGFYQFKSLGGFTPGGDAPDPKGLDLGKRPTGVGAMIFLRPSRVWEVRDGCYEGDIFSVYLDQDAVVIECTTKGGSRPD